MFNFVFRPSTAFAALLASAVTAFAQIQPQAEIDGQLLPILNCTREHIIVLQNGRRRQTVDLNYKVRPVAGFGEGSVQITDVHADLDPLRNAPPEERMKPDAVRFKYKATVTADREIADAYGLLTYVAQGSIGTDLVPIGRLSSGAPKTVSVELRSDVDSVGSLHLFGDGLELRSNQHPEPYTVDAYYAALMKDVKGLSAVELLQGEDVYPHELTDDGRFLATLRERDAKKMLIVYDLESMSLLCEAAIASARDYVGDLTWVSDHEIAYVADNTFDDRRSEYALHLFDVKTSQTKKVRDDIYGILAQLPDKPGTLVVHQFRTIEGSLFYKFDLRTGKDFDIEDPAAGEYYFDRNGVARVQVRYDSDKRLYAFRPTAKSRWRDAEDVVKQPGLRFNLGGDELLDRLVDVHSVAPDGDTLYISTRANSDKFELAAFSMTEGVIKQTIAKNPRYDITTSDGGLAQLLFAKKSTQLLGLIYEAQKPKVAWLDQRFAAVQKVIDQKFPDHVNLPVNWSADGTTIIYLSMSDQDPGTYYAVRAGSGLIPLLEIGAHLAGKTLAKTSPFEIVARDGQKIPTYVTRPTAASGPAPLLVHVHGGPMDRDTWRYDATNQFFASRGYIVLQVNYRGSSGYGAAFQRAGLHARLDTVIVDDIADATRALIANGEADPKRVAIMGASFGGWATYLSLAKYPDLYRAGIAISAVSDWQKSLHMDRWIFGNKVGYSYWNALLRGENSGENAKFIEAYRRVAEIKQPIFIIHGELDHVVDVDEAKRMINALKKTNQNVQSRIFPYASHSGWPFADRVVRLNESAKFLDRYLNSPAAPADAK